MPRRLCLSPGEARRFGLAVKASNRACLVRENRMKTKVTKEIAAQPKHSIPVAIREAIEGPLAESAPAGEPEAAPRTMPTTEAATQVAEQPPAESKVPLVNAFTTSETVDDDDDDEDVDGLPPMTKEEEDELATLETVLDGNGDQREREIDALLRIREKKWYRKTAKSFDAYLEQHPKWPYTRQWVSQQKKARKIRALVAANWPGNENLEDIQHNGVTLYDAQLLGKLEKWPGAMVAVVKETKDTLASLQNKKNKATIMKERVALWHDLMVAKTQNRLYPADLTIEEFEVVKSLGDGSSKWRTNATKSDQMILAARAAAAAKGITLAYALADECGRERCLPTSSDLLGLARHDDLKALCQPLDGLAEVWQAESDLADAEKEKRKKVEEAKAKLIAKRRSKESPKPIPVPHSDLQDEEPGSEDGHEEGAVKYEIVGTGDLGDASVGQAEEGDILDVLTTAADAIRAGDLVIESDSSLCIRVVGQEPSPLWRWQCGQISSMDDLLRLAVMVLEDAAKAKPADKTAAKAQTDVIYELVESIVNKL